MYFLVLAMLLCTTTAQAANIVPTTEYDYVKPGLLMIDQPKTEAQQQQVPDKPSTFGEAGVITQAMTFEDVERAYAEKKFELAAEHIMAIADSGIPAAEELIGLMYRNGEGFQQDPRKAFMWLLKAAEDNRPLAQHHIGAMYFEGNGVQADRVKALMWLTIAALHYPKGPNKDRAILDRDNLAIQVSRRERDSAFELAREWLDKRGEKNLMNSQ